MSKLLLLPIVLLVMGACVGSAMQSTLTPTSSPTPTPSPEATPEVTESPSEWLDFEINGIRLGVQKPVGWEVQHTGEGILIAEQFGSMRTETNKLYGIQIHLFVHSVNGYDIPADSNVAWAVLDKIAHTPRIIGNARVSEPQGFKWDNHDAAYYLLNNGDDSVTLLLAVALPEQQLIVFNISAPIQKSNYIRQVLLTILSSLAVDGRVMNGTALQSLPETLVFPAYPTPTPAR